MKEITIVGAGFSGLTLGRELLKKGFSVTLVDRHHEVGGLIQSLNFEGGLVETAAPSLSLNASMIQLLQELKLELVQPEKAAKKRLFFETNLVQIPFKITEIFGIVLKALYTRLFSDMKPRPFETLQIWATRCLTEKAFSKLISPAFQGIYAGDAKQLSATLLLGPLFEKTREKYLGLGYFRGGMKVLMLALKKDIEKRGGRILLNTTFETQKHRTDFLVIATSAKQAAELMSSIDLKTSEQLSRIKMSSLITATFFYDETTGPKAFGVLVRREQGLRTLGILLNHAIDPQRDAFPSETWILGGATDPEVLNLSDQEIQSLVQSERKIIFKRSNQPRSIKITRWQAGLPHYDLELEKIIQQIECPKGIRFHGNWLGGIGLSRIYQRSLKLADEISQELV